MPKTNKTYTRRNKRRVGRSYRVKKYGPSNPRRNNLVLKPYSYKFTLDSQILRATQSGTAGEMGWAGATGGIAGDGGTRPFTGIGPSITTGSCGLPNYYDIAMACSFGLNDIGNYASFTTMYDAYKLGKITLNIEYLNNVATINGGGLMPTMYLYWDQDDANVPTLLNIQGKQGVKVRQFGNHNQTVIKTSWTPTTVIAQQLEGGALAATAVNKPMWINCQDPSVRHYGLKIVLTDVYLSGATFLANVFRFNFEYDVKFRSPLLTT